MAEAPSRLVPTGPYKVEGAVRIVDVDGNEFELPEGEGIALCRCGQSRTKPFCVRGHRRVGFMADDCSPRVGLGASA